MKNQYIGDIGDFRKYALLRAISDAHGGPLRVCWMLTAPDGSSDGCRLAYLREPVNFRDLDPLVFDALAELVSAGKRSVQALQAANILPEARFHPDILTDSAPERELYFAAVSAARVPGELVFFDPDNGLEVPSVAKGTRNSSRYLYWDELIAALGDGRTVCVYQHFPRRPRAVFLAEMFDRLEALAPEHTAFAATSSWAAYLLCVPHEHAAGLLDAAADLAGRPGSRLVVMHRPHRRSRPLAREGRTTYQQSSG